MEYCNRRPGGPGRPEEGCGLERLCEHFRGQPIECLTSDGVRFCGIALLVCGDGVKIVGKCNRVIFVPFRHIDAVVEPRMVLPPFCGKPGCRCGSEDCGCGEGDDFQTPVPLKDRWDD